MSSAHSSPNGDTETVAESASASVDGDTVPPSDDDQIWADVLTRWSELREYASYFVAANLDQARLRFRTAVTWSVMGAVVGMAAIGTIAAASVLFVQSLSMGVGHLLGGRIWLGQLVVSSLLLITASGGAWLVAHRSLRAYQHNLIEKYERRKQCERTKYGTDVEQRAQEGPNENRQTVE